MNPSSKRLDGRLAIVTGAASGIGAAICRCFADQGASLCLSTRTLRVSPRWRRSYVRSRQSKHASVTFRVRPTSPTAMGWPPRWGRRKC